MPAAANIALLDAQATPVSHTYVPLGPDPKDTSIFWFEDQSQVSPIGYWKLSVQIKRPPPAAPGISATALTSRFNLATVMLWQPVLETVNSATYSGITPAPQLSYVPKSSVEFVFPERSTLQNRKDLRKMVALALADTNVLSAIENLSPFY